MTVINKLAHFLYSPIVLLFLVMYLIYVLLIIYPVIIFRHLLGCLRPLLRKDLGNILNAESSILKVDGVNVVVSFYVDGDLCLEYMRDFFVKRVILTKDDTGVLKYPELQQYVSSWCGFLFWKWDENFHIENHIFVYDASQHKSHEDLVKHLETSPFEQYRSPWNIFLLKNCPANSNARIANANARNYNFNGKTDIGNTSIVIFRFCHSMMDGFALMTILYKEMAGIPLKPFKVPTPVDNLVVRSAKLFSLLFTQGLSFFVNRNTFFDTNAWHPRNFSVSPIFDSQFRLYTSDFIEMQQIKNIQKMYNVCTSTVVFAAITGALRKIMLLNGVTVPPNIRLRQPFPRESHPGKLLNHFDLSEIALPVGISDPVDKLEFLQREITASNNGVLQLGFRNLLTLPLLLPTFTYKLFPTSQTHTVTFSRVASPPNLTIFGKNVIHYDFATGIVNGNTPLYIFCNGYHGAIRFTIQIQNNLLTPHDVNQMFSFLYEELHLLEGTKNHFSKIKFKTIHFG